MHTKFYFKLKFLLYIHINYHRYYILFVAEIVLTSGNKLSDKNIKYSKFKIYKLFIKI